MKKVICPIAVAYGFSSQSGFSFILPGREVIIQGADEIIPMVLQQCTGYKTIEEIVSSISSTAVCTKDDLRKLIRILLRYEAIIDIRDYHRLFHKFSVNPSLFQNNVSEKDLAKMLKRKSPLAKPFNGKKSAFEGLLENRESTREFSGQPISKKEIVRLGWAAYGKLGRSTSFPESTIGLGTIPSGGALYPLRLFVAIIRTDGSVKEGVYRFNPRGMIMVNKIDQAVLREAFGGYSNPIDSVAAIFIISCDFHQTTQKYSSRGYRYALIEAGHASQNVYLWCTEQDLGVVEVCGFSDVVLAKLIKVPYPKYAPLTTLFVGRRL